MSAKNFFKNLNSKKNDKYAYVIIGIITIILSILVLLGLIEMTSKDGTVANENQQTLIGVIFLVMGIIFIIIGIVMIKKDNKNKKSSVYYKILDDYKNNKFKSNFMMYDLNLENLKVHENDNDSLYITYDYKNGFFEAFVDVKDVTLSFDFNDDFWDNVEDEKEVEEIPILNKFEELNSLELSVDEFYSKFAKFIKENEHLI